jgi:Tryptophan-rich Synechocystis species C-terminal domain
VRATDGTFWSAWQSNTITVPGNQAPVVHGSNKKLTYSPTSATSLSATVNTSAAANSPSVPTDPSVDASSLFTATDPDGDIIITYALKDMTGNGYFVVNGVAQATNVEIDLTATQLAQTIYQSGSGTDQLAVSAFDGMTWSSWQTFTITAPVITVVETLGSTNLTKVDSSFYFGASGAQLKYAGAAVAADQYGGWMPIAAEATASGYEVAWKLAGSNLYTIWNTDSSGNTVSNTAVLAATSTSLESLEASFHQDLNGDGTIGLPTTVIETFGSTSLTKVGNNFYFGASGAQLKYAGAAVAADQYGGWMPIAADATASGYEVAWKLAGSNLYTIWNTDSSGNTVSNTAVLAATSTSLESLEASFHQDLNGDGTIGLPSSGISAASLTPSAPIVVSSGANVEITSAYAGAVTFTDSTGTLKLDHSSSFAGTVAGMGAQDTLDLADINFATLQQPIFSGNTSGGMLNVTDGTHTANIALLGNYMASTFVTSSDGHGGTYIVDPSVASQTTLAQPLHA